MITIQSVDDVHGATVALSDGTVHDVAKLDAFNKADIVLVVDEGVLLPASIAKYTCLHRIHAVEDKEHPGFFRMIEPGVIKVDRLFPTKPYHPTIRPKQQVSFVVGSTGDGVYAQLLGAKYPEPLTPVDSGDDFDLDEEAPPDTVEECLEQLEEVDEPLSIEATVNETLAGLAALTDEQRADRSQALDELTAEAQADGFYDDEEDEDEDSSEDA